MFIAGVVLGLVAVLLVQWIRWVEKDEIQRPPGGADVSMSSVRLSQSQDHRVLLSSPRF